MLIGVVGKTNTGKSTFFKAATLAEIEIENRPFVTIKPNHGLGYVRTNCAEKEFNLKCQPKHGFCLKGIRFVPIELLDVAGLVPGAHEGKGMGNQFLDDLRQADALIHIIDVSGSTNENGETVVPGSYDPSNDIKFLETELDMWYLRLLKKGWGTFARQVSQEKQEPAKALTSHLTGLGIDENLVESLIKGFSENLNEWTEDTLRKLATELRKITKPMIIACNKIDVPGAEENFTKLENEFPDHMLIGCSAESELALREAAKHELIDYIPGESDFTMKEEDKLSERQKQGLQFVKENVLSKFSTTGVQKVLDEAVFNLLKLITVYPVENENKLTDSEGNVLPDIHLLQEGSTPLSLAYKVHNDIGKRFNCAIDGRSKKKLGKEYILSNNDILKIVTS